ncbi:hypothetical protein BC2230_11026 [Burkholderia cepacia]
MDLYFRRCIPVVADYLIYRQDFRAHPI